MLRLTTNLTTKFQALRRAGGAGRLYVFNYDYVLGTSLELRIRATSTHSAKRAEDEALIEIDRLETILSGWSNNSELSRWLKTHGEAVHVSPELADVLRSSDVWRIVTGRAFDPAAQEIIDTLSRDENASPDDFRAGYGRLWTVDISASTARLLTPAAISLDAIAKGYVVAQAATCAWRIPGVTDVVVKIGGDIQHFGAQSTVVGIQDPFAPKEKAEEIGAVRIQNSALATSCGYRSALKVNGKRASQIVDPRTGKPVDHIASASVFAPNCATAGALATAFSVMKPQESVALADAIPGIGCMLVERDGTITTSSAWMDCAVYTDHLQVA